MNVTLTITSLSSNARQVTIYPNAAEARRELLRVARKGNYRMVGRCDNGSLTQERDGAREAVATYAIAIAGGSDD